MTPAERDPSLRRGTCRVCRTRRRLDDDGRVGAHPTPVEPSIPCDGAGRLPLEAAMRS